MSHHSHNHGAGPNALVLLQRACGFGLCLLAGLLPGRTLAQDAGTAASAAPRSATPVAARRQPPVVTPGVAPGTAAPVLAPGTTATAAGPVLIPEGHGPERPPAFEPNVQLVRFFGPAGLGVEVLAPQPGATLAASTPGIATFGLERGIGYRLRLMNITERPGVELFPVIEVVGHLHRPREVDPAKYPIRVVFTNDELWDVVDRGRLVTKVIYLEEPELAAPVKVARDEVPVVTLNPTEEPLKVAQRLGRVMAIVRIGGRRPTVEEIHAGATGDFGLDAVAAMGSGHCPFSSTSGAACPLPRGPVCGTPPPAGRPWLPRDEYLCDGGDTGEPAGVGAGGNMRGIDPRDAVMRFDVGLNSASQPRVLPTNRVCVYAPRFAEVHVSTGTNQAIEVHGANLNRRTESFELAESRMYARRLVQNQSPELTRVRRRAQGFAARVVAGEDSNTRNLDMYHNVQQVKVDSQRQDVQLTRTRTKAMLARDRIRLDGIKSVESTVMTGKVEGPAQEVMSWQPHEMNGVETPPKRPGVAIIKRVSVLEAKPGDTVTFTITYRNMGNTPIHSAQIVDSLLPRLEYVRGSARGPHGTSFTAEENRASSEELKWVLPGVIPPGGSGSVSFQAVVR